MNRRQFLQLSAGAAAAIMLGGHTPFGQWVIYRQKHLLIGCHKEDSVTYDLAKQVALKLEEHLPAAKSRVARAPDAGRLASLLGTGQMDVAILSYADAGGMAAGNGAFTAYGATDLKMLIPVADRILICRADFPDRHAWLVTGALTGTDIGLNTDFPPDIGLDPHPGSLAFLSGEQEPGDE